LTQVPPQFVCPVGQQTPFEQLVPVPQVVPQVPQLPLLLDRSAQTPPQFV
jgi:hypothetical protein